MNTHAAHAPHSPRDYAAAILAEPARERRKQMLEACPPEWRDLVREHVASGFATIQAYRQHQAQRALLASQKPPAAPRREDHPNIINHPRSAPEVGSRHLAALRAVVGNGGRV